ncbi:hypothetical protein RB195_025146 [Necator americanus]|uniref:Uncharacterized protein n=1 Tax=Necator americanus TaxID=51031 RepID=A0ABR1ER20_NECAM
MEFGKVLEDSTFLQCMGIFSHITVRVLHNGLPPHSDLEVTLGVELRCTAEVRPPAGSPKLRRSSTHQTFRLLVIGSLAKSKPLLRFTTVLAKCRKVVP